MTRPIEVELPDSDRPGQLIASMVTLLRSLGWELGKRYDDHMRPLRGKGWLEELRRQRDSAGGPALYRRPLNLTDPSFCLSEPLHHPDSPLRECLPRGREFYDVLGETLQIRHGEQHFDREPSLDALAGRARVIGKLASLAGLAVAQDCTRVRERVALLKANDGHLPGLIPPEVIDELKERLDLERRRAAALAGSAAEAKQKLAEATSRLEQDEDRAEQLLADVDQLRAEMAAVQAQRDLAQEQLASAQRATEQELMRLRSDSAMELLDLTPGDEWPTAPGQRVLRLLPHVEDLFDPLQVSLFSDEVGEVAVEAARRWMTSLPHGGIVHLTPAGQACALIGTRWAYLGGLDGP